MSKIKRCFAAFISGAMAANMLFTLPLSAFADNEESYSYVYDGYTIDYDIVDSWGENNQNVNVTITNTGTETIENWMLAYDLNGEATGMWNGNLATENDMIYVRNAGYNANIASNESVEFGYCLSAAEGVPSDFTMCQTRVLKYSGFDVTLNVNQTWEGGFNGEIVLANTTDEPIVSWELTFDSDFTITEITNSWAASVIDNGNGNYTLKGTYTNIIYPQSSVSLGFIGVANGEPYIVNSSMTEVVVDTNSRAFLKDYDISDIKNMNADSYYPIEVLTHDNGIVYSIDGKFSNVAVTDAKSALSSLYNVRTLLGISSPANELKLDYVYDSSVADYSSYFFNQIYKGVKVYGRNVTVVARSDGEVLSLDSNFTKIAGLSVNPTLSDSDIKAEYGCESIELVVYTLDEFESAPVLAYVCNNANETLVISADTGEVIVCRNSITENSVSETNGEYDIITDENGNLIHMNGTKYSEFVEYTDSSIGSSDDAETAIDNIVSEGYNLAVDFSESHPENDLKYVDAGYRDLAYGPSSITKNEWHYFTQYYNGVEVYGRAVVLKIGSYYRMRSFDSNVVEIAENGEFDVEPDFAPAVADAKLVIYTWDENENTVPPRLAYIYEEDINGDSINDRTVIQFNDKDFYYKPLGKGLDEGCFENTADPDEEPKYTARAMKLCYFPITYNNGQYLLSTKKLSLDVDAEDAYPNNIKVEFCLPDYPSGVVSSSKTYFYVQDAVAAYINAIKVCNWYANTPGIQRYYYTDMQEDFRVGISSNFYSDNAFSGLEYICVCEKDVYPYTDAASYDIIGHEFTHGVFNKFALEDAFGADGYTVKGINEGYADVFGNFMDDDDWLHGESITGNSVIESDRNAANPPTFEIDFNSSITERDEHDYIPYITYPVYRMAKLGIDKTDLCKLYYSSMTQGRYSTTSNMNSVRINVLKAAKALGFDDDKIQKITAAFDEIWQYDSSEYELTINAVDYDAPDTSIANAKITLKSTTIDSLEYTLNNNEAQVVEPGWYYITIEADGYVTYSYRMHMSYKNSTRTFKIVKDSETTSNVSVYVYDFVNKLPVDTTVNLYQLTEGSEVLVGSYQTGALVGSSPGYTANIALSPGYYVAFVEEGYHFFYQPAIIAPGEDKTISATYYDLDLNSSETTDVFYFDTIVYREDCTDTALNDEVNANLSELVPNVNTLYDADGNRFVSTGKDITEFGNRFYVYCYERKDEEILVGYTLNQKQCDLIMQLADVESQNPDFAGKLYNIDITFSNRQDYNYSSTTIITLNQLAEKIRCSGYDSNGNREYFVEFARIKFDSDTNRCEADATVFESVES